MQSGKSSHDTHVVGRERHDHDHAQHPQGADAVATGSHVADSAAQGAEYTCPMHTDIRQTGPGC